ncbi:hypothetical protein WJX79_006910 [Trebouxia sp. C0005]
MVGGVVALLMGNQHLHGAMTEEVWPALGASLKYLDLSGNDLEGSIPTSLSLLPKLIYINLANNTLVSSIPPAMFHLQRLTHLLLSQNTLQGTLPQDSTLVSLKVLDVSRNQLTGAVPVLQHSSNLQVAFFSHNQFSGSVPVPAPVNQLGTKYVAFELGMSNNLLTGTIPAEYQYLPVRNLDLSQNQLTGDISVLALMPFLARARVSENRLTGSLPVHMASSILQELDVHSNMLTGKFPAKLLDLTDLSELRLSNNSFRGVLPALAASSSLTNLYVRSSGLGPPALDSQNPDQDRLPNFLKFDRRHRVRPVPDSNFSCWKVVANRALAPHLDYVEYDASLFGCQHCSCPPGFNLSCPDNGTAPGCISLPDIPSRSSTLRTIGVIVALLVVLLGSAFCNTGLTADLCRLCLGAGNPLAETSVTLVCTDVEGSTEMWEWDNKAMMEAISLHDRVMRMHLPKFGGYEVATEGDAFLIAFHTPGKAVGWAAATQQSLLTARWPLALQQNKHSCIQQLQDVYLSVTNYGDVVGVPPIDGNGTSEFLDLSSVDPRSIIMWGLRVRMAIATDAVESIKVNEISKRKEYGGKVRERVQALSEACHGGQIIIDAPTFEGITNCMADLSNKIPVEPDFAAISEYAREMHPLDDDESLGSSLSAPSSAAQKAAMALAFLGPNHRGNVTFETIEEGEDTDTQALEGKSTGEVDLGSTMNSAVSFADSTGDGDKPGGLRRRQSSIYASPSGNLAAFTTKPSWKTTMSRSFKKLTTFNKGRHAEQSGDRLIIIDMGSHMLTGQVGSQNLLQVAVPGLEDRARTFSPLHGVLLMPGYFEAPGALTYGLGRVAGALQAFNPQPVTIVFCNMDNLPLMKAADLAATEEALVMFRYKVRRALRDQQGYECQEADGDFMLAFSSPCDAARFCLSVQQLLLEGAWSDRVLALPGCGPALSSSMEVLWVGPRARMGISEAIPSRVVPHTTSGRADYFGPLVNRAARLCHSAAHGGQVLAPLDLVQHLVKTWAGIDLELAAHHKPVKTAKAHSDTELAELEPLELHRRGGRRRNSLSLANHDSSAVRSALGVAQKMSINLQAVAGPGHDLGSIAEGLGDTANPPPSPSGTPNMPPGSTLLGPSPLVRGMSGSGLGRLHRVGSNPINDINRRSFSQVQVEVWHVGSFRFKGLPEPVHVMHLGSTLVSGRVFPSHTPSKKAERVAPALGLQCIVAVPAI